MLQGRFPARGFKHRREAGEIGFCCVDHFFSKLQARQALYPRGKLRGCLRPARQQ